MGLLVGEIQFLSEKWRRTVVLVVMIVCVSALGIVGIIIFEQQEILAATTAMLIILGRRGLGLKNKEEKQLIRQANNLGGKKEKTE